MPGSVLNNLPKHAQEVYRAACNSLWDEYLDARRDDASCEEVSHRVAWAAVEQRYEKDDLGWWREK